MSENFYRFKKYRKRKLATSLVLSPQPSLKQFGWLMNCFLLIGRKPKMEYAEENFDRNKRPNLLTFLVESISLYIESLVRQCNLMLRKFMENFEIIEFFDAISDKLAEHPLLRFIVFASAITCSIPAVMFVIFGITSVIITFAGFLFIEGTLLAVGGLCMFICMATMILVLSLLTVTSVALYVLTIKFGSILNRFETTSSIMKSIAHTHSTVQTNRVSSSTDNAHQD